MFGFQWGIFGNTSVGGFCNIETFPRQRGALTRSVASLRGKLRILLVEDDPAVAEMFRSQLAADGFEVRVAGDGQVALSLVRQQLPDLVLLDMQMPRLDGISTLKRLRAQVKTRGLPVVVLSNSPASTRMEEAYALGIRAWLVNSTTSPAQLSGIVRAMLS
jgi:CheY-like chemotaxis protein